MDIEQKLHIALFPWLAYGHILPFFQIAKFLAQKGHHVYYISTPNNIRSIHPRLPTNLSSHLSFVQLPLPHVDGLPNEAESTADLPIHEVPYLKRAYDMLQLPLTNFLKSSHVTWIIHDFASYWLPSAAAQLGVNSVFFSIYGASSLCFLGPPSELLEGSRQKPEDFAVVPKWIDFPSNVAFKLHEMVTHQECMDSVSDFYRFGKVIEDCRVVIVRSCPEFEPDAFTLLGKLYQKPVFPIGFLPPSPADDSVSERNWQVLKEWLNGKKEKSVVYVALGTEAALSRELMHELAHGLEKSRLPFIWVVKKRLRVEGEVDPDLIPPGFMDRNANQGIVWTEWAPQVRILSHPSVGGFLTHSGWSSVIEALGSGRPLILLSGAGSDTGLVARLMHSRRVGLEIDRNEVDGSFSSELVAESIRRVIVNPEGEPLRANAWAMREIYGYIDLHIKYLDKFTRFIENTSTPMRSL